MKKFSDPISSLNRASFDGLEENKLGSKFCEFQRKSLITQIRINKNSRVNLKTTY